MNVPRYDKLPFFARMALILVMLISIGYIAIIGKELLSPLIFALLFSILLLPLANFLERKCRLPRPAAAGISVVLLLAFLVTLMYLLGSQFTSLSADYPMFKEQILTSIKTLQAWINTRFHYDVNKQLETVTSSLTKLLGAGTAAIGTVLISLSSILLFLVFIMLYTFFLLCYRKLLMKFLLDIFREENAAAIYEITGQIQMVIRQYIIGLLLEMAIVVGSCGIAFYALGIKYAFLFGLLTGMLNIIPYIGIFTALVISTLITFATGAAASKIFLVMVVVISMHLIDSNVLLPLVVGSKVRINALITVVGVIFGEMMWGIPGMFLALPVIAMAKIIFDRVETLKPWGALLGDDAKNIKPAKVLTRRGFVLRRQKPVVEAPQKTEP
ncbi:MAG: AI-2E family transporter [Chitinophagaceae bacterium]